MACRPPMRPKSTPYWKGESTMMPQATKHFQWAFHVSSLLDAIPRVEKGFVLGFVFDPQGRFGSVMNSRTESMQDGEVQGGEENRLQRSLADVLPPSRYIPMSIWSSLVINMDRARLQLCFHTPDSILQSGEAAKCRPS
jgi:hypothetical protein